MLMRPCDDPRLLESLRHSCGPLFMNALEDPEVIEIMLTPSHRLLILEDTAELQSQSPNAVFFRTSVLANVEAPPFLKDILEEEKRYGLTNRTAMCLAV